MQDILYTDPSVLAEDLRDAGVTCDEFSIIGSGSSQTTATCESTLGHLTLYTFPLASDQDYWEETMKIACLAVPNGEFVRGNRWAILANSYPDAAASLATSVGATTTKFCELGRQVGNFPSRESVPEFAGFASVEEMTSWIDQNSEQCPAWEDRTTSDVGVAVCRERGLLLFWKEGSFEASPNVPVGNYYVHGGNWLIVADSPSDYLLLEEFASKTGGQLKAGEA